MADRLAIPNHHGPLPDELDLGPDRFISTFQGHSGKQSVFSAHRTSQRVQLCVVDDEGLWVVEEISYNDMDGPFVFDGYEQMWLIACWASLLGKPVFEVARKYLTALQARTLVVSLGMPAEVHAHFFGADELG
jgi:hypothetical protein